MLCFASLAVLLLGHLFQVQIGEHTALAAAAAKEDNMNFVLTAHRGEILDSDGQVLVGTVATYSVYVDPALTPADSRDQAAAQIAAVLRISESQVVQVLSEPNQYAFLADHVSETVKDQLSLLNVNGLILTEEDEPVYEPSAVPGETSAANLLGFVNASGQGQYGVEGYYNSLLTVRVTPSTSTRLTTCPPRTGTTSSWASTPRSSTGPNRRSRRRSPKTAPSPGRSW
jgi:cell division protein FtsI/penicillin-binding protein 2